MIRVRIADPCRVGRFRFPALRRFVTLRDAERYVRRAARFRLAATIECVVRRRAGAS